MARSATGHDAPDPSTAGSIRFIVRSAHKWGGNGVIPLFNKIKKVLLAKHPEVIAKAFGGDANKAAAWIKDNWMAMHGHDPTHWRGKGKTTAQQLATSMCEDPDSEYWGVALSDEWSLEDLYQPALALSDEIDGIELFCAEPADLDEEKDGLLWHPVCRTGEWVRSPTGKGKLQITKQHFENALDAFENKAWENVTIPLTHEDRAEENTGYIKAFEIRPDPTRDGEYRLWAGHKFTEPGIEEKVRRKSIIGRSVLMSIDKYRDTETGKLWPTVIKHVSLTNKPWINGLNDGVVSLSEEDEETIEGYEPAEEAPKENNVLSIAKKLVAALQGEDPDPEEDPEDEVQEQMDAIAASLDALEDVDSDKIHGTIVIVKGGVAKMGEKNEGTDTEIRLSQEDFDAMVAKASKDAVDAALADERTKATEREAALEARLSKNEEEANVLRVDKLIAGYQEKGVPPATLTRVRELMLAKPDENGDIKLSIEEDGEAKEVTLSKTEQLTAILDSIPSDLLEKGQIALSKTHSGGGTPPPEDNNKDLTADEAKAKADALYESMRPVEA